MWPSLVSCTRFSKTVGEVFNELPCSALAAVADLSSAGAAGVHKQAEECILVRVRQARDGADRTTLTEQVADAGAIFSGQFLHERIKRSSNVSS